MLIAPRGVIVGSREEGKLMLESTQSPLPRAPHAATTLQQQVRFPGRLLSAAEARVAHCAERDRIDESAEVQEPPFGMLDEAPAPRALRCAFSPGAPESPSASLIIGGDYAWRPCTRGFEGGRPRAIEAPHALQLRVEQATADSRRRPEPHVARGNASRADLTHLTYCRFALIIAPDLRVVISRRRLFTAGADASARLALEKDYDERGAMREAPLIDAPRGASVLYRPRRARSGVRPARSGRGANLVAVVKAIDARPPERFVSCGALQASAARGR